MPVNNLQSKMTEFVSALHEHYSLSAPINVESFVKVIGGEIIKSTDLPYNISGCVKKVDDTSFCIYVRNTEAENRRRFTVAHELGHLFFDMGFVTDPETWKKIPSGTSYNRSVNYYAQESVANVFAAEFLMPKNEFISVFNKNIKDSMVNMTSVAMYFGVSVDAAVTRGRWLGLLEW